MLNNEILRERRGSVPEVNVVTMQSERRPVLPAIRWGAVFAGVAVGISVHLALTLLGIATGLTSFSMANGASPDMAPLIWSGISMLVAAFCGGYVAARMSGLKRKADGILHGAVSWAVTTILFAVLATSIGGALLSGVFNNMSYLAQADATASGESPLAVLLHSQGVDANPEALRQLQQYLQAGERTQAMQHMSNAMGVEPARAETIVDQALILTGSPEAASQAGRTAAENSMEKVGAAAWAVFLTVALALALGIAGGAAGAAGCRRANWTGNQATTTG